MSEEAPALLPRRMSHPVVAGPQALSLSASDPALRLPVEQHRGRVTLTLPPEAANFADLQWRQNGLALPDQHGPSLRLADLSLDDTDSYHATWTDASGKTCSSQGAIIVVYPGHTLANHSARGFVAPGQPVIAGFVVGRSRGPVRAKRYLIRVVSTSLQRFGIERPLANPIIGFSRRTKDCLELLQTDPALVAAGNAEVGAFALDADADEFAAVADLPPGPYCVMVNAPADSAGGEVLVEVYETQQ